MYIKKYVISIRDNPIAYTIFNHSNQTINPTEGHHEIHSLTDRNVYCSQSDEKLTKKWVAYFQATTHIENLT